MSLDPEEMENRRSPQLLVSVRDLAEWDDAIAAEVDIVDLKEPRRGALAAADPMLWAQVAVRAQSLGRGTLISAALGETSEAKRVARLLPPEFTFAKVGPSGCDCPRQMRETWRQVEDRLAHPIELVGVAYCDAEAAGCLSPEEVFRLAAAAGLRRCLIDTYRKDGRSSVDLLGLDRLRGLEKIALAEGLWWALAGSIKSSSISTLCRGNIHPDCLGVRGDVCEHGRAGRLSPDRVTQWQQTLEATFPDAPAPVNPPNRARSC